jgi:multidrug resistance efflux pump
MKEDSSQLQQNMFSFHSEEVQEIMGRRPSWILRWGITVIIGIALGIIAGCYFIKYPQTVTAAITLTSDYPPSDLAARATGILDSVYVENGSYVEAGQLLALIASAARYEDITRVEEMLNMPEEHDPKLVPDTFRLGNLQHNWIEYLRACLDYRDYLQIDQIGRKKQLLVEQIQQSKYYYAKLGQQREILNEELRYERKGLRRDSVLFLKKAISEAEYETTLKTYISRKNNLAGFEASMTSAYLSRLQLEQQIMELDTQRTVEAAEFERRINQAKESLLGQIALWKEQYEIIAPYAGLVSLQNVWSRGQRVSVGDIIASVAPAGGMKVKGRLKVPSSGFGKVLTGQEVNIKLNGFPYLEFGILKGEVASISSVPEITPDGLIYTVDVSLPNGLESTYKKEFPFVQNMDGYAEIITDDMRLIEQFVRPIRSLFRNQ